MANSGTLSPLTSPRAAGSPEQELRPARATRASARASTPPSRRFTRTGIETRSLRRSRRPGRRCPPSRRFTRTGIETAPSRSPPSAQPAPRAAGSPEQELRPRTSSATSSAARAPRAAGSPEQELRPGVAAQLGRLGGGGPRAAGSPEQELRRGSLRGLLGRRRLRPEPQVHQNRN